jgi:hypothetical protein
MRNLCAHLNKLGITVLDLSQPGWVPTPENIAKLAGKIKEIPDNANIPVILDVLGVPLTSACSTCQREKV